MGSGVGSGWDPVGSGVKKWDPGGFRGVFFRRKRWDPIRPAQGFIILKAGTHLWQLALSAPWRLFCNFFVEFYQPSGKNFLIFPSLVSDFCENPNERQTRSCLSQTGAGFLFHLDSPSWPVRAWSCVPGRAQSADRFGSPLVAAGLQNSPVLG